MNASKRDNQNALMSFAFDTFGCLKLDVVNILKRVKRVMYNNVISPRSLDEIFKGINFIIQKGLAA
jgi:hypothetical protein